MSNNKNVQQKDGIDTLSVEMGKKLEELRNEFQAGQKMLADLTQKRTELEATMLRISGAIQVLDELLAAPDTKGE